MEDTLNPDPKSEPGGKLRVGLTFNVKKGVVSEAADIEAEYDHIETVLSIKKALEKLGCGVFLMEADRGLAKRLEETPVDIVFNIAEGIQGRGREAEVPAILNLFGIPFVGSDETTLCIALDKALTKRLISTYGISTPKYRVVPKDSKNPGGRFTFPAIVKPNAEGSSKGISDVCIAADRAGLKKLLAKNFELYSEDMLVEEYIGGREFTVGLLGNGDDIRVFRPMEVVFLNKTEKFNVYSFTVKQNYKELIRYDCPADIDSKTEAAMTGAAEKIYRVLGCRDFARMDFRLSEDGKLFFIEINPLPGLAPGYSDFPMLAEFNGMGYEDLVQNILKCALKRLGIRRAANGDD